MSRYLLASVGLLAMHPAMAQTTAATNPEPTPTADQSTQGKGIQDIIVTASRRAENVQRSALSIQALTPEALTRAGVARPEDLSTIAAGVNVGTGGNNPQTYIRGVGNYATDAYAEGAVAYNIDGVYISRPWATRGLFYDLDRIEVLKGPQGTLYGRNASGGAINILSAKPKLDKTEGYIEGESGNYSLLRASGAVNIPLGQTVALRAAGQVTSRDGYLSDGSDDDKSQSARLSLLWKPSEEVSVILHGGYQHVGGRGAGSVAYPYRFGDAWTSASAPAVTALFRAEPGIGGLLVVPQNDNRLNMRVYSIDGELNWNFGPATLTVLPAYRDSRLYEKTYVPGFADTNQDKDRQTSLEARLGNASATLKWVLGGYYFNEDLGNPAGADLMLVEQGVNTQRTGTFSTNIRSYAAFGQATYSLLPTLRVTGGLRYTNERKTQAGVTHTWGFPACSSTQTFDPNTPSPPLFCRTDIPLTGTLNYNSVTWKAGFEYDVAPHSMAFANFSTGFKSGGFFAAPQPNTFRPEKLYAWEAGIKNRFFDNRLQVNLEAFYWIYKDHQEAHLGPTSLAGFFTFITENAGSAKSYGLDVDTLLKASENDELTLKVQWNKTKYDSFVYTNPTGAFGPPVTGCAVGPLTNGAQTVNCSGFQLVRSPTWSGTAGYRHTFRIATGSTIDWAVSTQFSSGYYQSIDFLRSGYQDAFATLNSDLTYTAPNGRFSLTGYVHNITNQAVATQGFRSPFVSAANPQLGHDALFLSTLRPPRTFGVRARINF